MNSIWIDIGLSLFSGILIAAGLLQIYRYFYARQTGQEVDFMLYLFGDATEGKEIEDVLKSHFFSGIGLFILGVAGVVAMFIFF